MSVIREALRLRLGLVVNSDFEIAGPSRSIAHELMLASSVPVHNLGLGDRTAGFTLHLDNGTATVARILERNRSLVREHETAPILGRRP